MKHTAEVMKFSNQSAQASKGISLGERLVFADVLNIVCRALHANGWYADSELSQQYRNFLISPASPLCVAQVLGASPVNFSGCSVIRASAEQASTACKKDTDAFCFHRNRRISYSDTHHQLFER